MGLKLSQSQRSRWRWLLVWFSDLKGQCWHPHNSLGFFRLMLTNAVQCIQGHGRKKGNAGEGVLSSRLCHFVRKGSFSLVESLLYHISLPWCPPFGQSRTKRIVNTIAHLGQFSLPPWNQGNTSLGKVGQEIVVGYAKDRDSHNRERGMPMTLWVVLT